ncbi:AP2/ERF [Ectocarpus sp. CCAP 1310/34]|nr:AP2/ERF [Ectocarpus sp. CCAP 1310/34]
MTALIADTSPILRNIPSDPADRRSFEFSPSPMPSQYLSEGTARQDHRRHSPSPHNYTAREVPALYPHRYGYNIGGSFAHSDPEVPAVAEKQQQQLAFKPTSSCRCQRRQCSCNSSPSETAQKDSSSSEPPHAMWRNSKGGDANMTTARPSFFHGEAPAQQPPAAVSVSAPSRSPSPSAAILAQNRQQHSSRVLPRTIELTSSPSKKSDWENLLGAVDLELRAQQRSKFVPDSTPATPVPSHHYARAINAAHLHYQHQPLDDAPPLLTGGGYTQQQRAAASVSPEFGPVKTAPAPAGRHHRRGGGGDDYPGGGPAYSGSTADAACLLATLPQRMLDRASTSSSSKNHDHHHQTANSAAAATAAAAAAATMGGGGVGIMPPALVSASGPPVTPVRVQASGRRGPRGQSRFKGVCITRAGKWRAVIYIGRKQKYLGVFDSEFDAARAYDAAALQHFAEGAKLNFPDGIERQLNDISSVSGRPFATAGAGGAAAPRSCTPPATYLEGDAAAAPALPSPTAKRSRKTAFGDHDEDGWAREDGPWHPSRR